MDLDETCVSSIENTIADRAAVKNPHEFEHFDMFNNLNVECTTYLRPHLAEFLTFAKSIGDLSYWSAGEKNYVLDILAQIDPNPCVVLWRNHCDLSQTASNSLKSIPWLLAKIPKVDNPPILLVDDLAETCMNNGSFAYRIKEFSVTKPDAKSDDELLTLRKKLESAR